MKRITTTLALLGTLTFSLAQDATIDAQIEEIQNASLQERVKLMNQLKLRLSAMNQEDRSKSIAKMQATMQAAGTKAQVRERERIRKSQVEATEEMPRAERMNQNQMGSQVSRDSGGAQAVRIPMH